VKINFKTEIEGLRGLAVLAVVIYHANISYLNHSIFGGGFLGVDIFFIISGYLITSIIIQEYKIKKKILFLNFYERRIRRIVPLLLFVIITTTVFSYFFLLPELLLYNADSSISSIFFISNIYYYLTGSIYGADSEILKPLIHTWSLSVEGQFYLIFPIFFSFLYKKKIKNLFKIIFITLFLSLIICLYLSKNNTMLNFYSIQSRLWELLFGSITFLLFKDKKIKLNTKYNKFLSLTGLLILVFCLLTYSENLKFLNYRLGMPSINIFPVMLGTFLILYFPYKNNFLSNIIFTKLGLISYSLYLWHYPIFAFARNINFLDNSNFLMKFLLIVITIILSIFTYLLIEKPFRNIKKINTKKFILIIFILYLAIIIPNLYYIIKKGDPNRLPEIVIKNNNQYQLNLKNINNEICFDKSDNFCTFGDPNKKKIFIIGDSVAGSLMNGLKDPILKLNYQFVAISKGSCIYLPNFNLIYKKTEKINRQCDVEYQNNVKNLILNNKESLIILSGRYPLYIEQDYLSKSTKTKNNNFYDKFYFKSKNNGESVSEGIKNSIEQLAYLNNKILIVYPIPEPEFNIKRKILSNNLFSKKYISSILDEGKFSIDYDRYKEISNKSFYMLNSIQNSNVFRVYPHLAFCNTKIINKCITHDSENIFYIDETHLSDFGAEIVNKLIIKKIEEIMRP
jgi:peptidoglycan/LPS O-acetylase OafA/YrhL